MTGRSAALLMALSLFVGAVGGAAWSKSRSDRAAAAAIIAAHQENLKRNDEVVNGWARSLDYLRSRLRAGDTPKIPVSRPPAAPLAAGRPDAGPADDVPAAGALATCRAERQRLIEDAAMTTIQLRELQQWAR